MTPGLLGQHSDSEYDWMKTSTSKGQQYLDIYFSTKSALFSPKSKTELRKIAINGFC